MSGTPYRSYMDFLSLGYVLFIALLLALYYGVPAVLRSTHTRWEVLLCASLAFYAWSSPQGLVFILITAAAIYYSALRIHALQERSKAERKDRSLTAADKKAIKAKYVRQQRLWLLPGLGVAFGILIVLKYAGALLPVRSGGLLLPLGISFYTFQSTGYLIDIYGGKYAPEESYPRFLLFVSWFPQLLQGPIGRFDRLEAQLLAPHQPSYESMRRNLLLVLFGFVKKCAVADLLSPYIADILDNPVSGVPGSMIVCGILLYSAQQYADFSGGIDIVTGVSGLFGIELAPNFRQPYFSVSLGDFWRRWHISLGAWMRDYVFYPFALLRPMQRLGKWCTKRCGKHLGRVLPAGIANILVFLIVGIWHGASMHYVLWGLYNGLVIALSDITAPFWKRVGTRLHMEGDGAGMRTFRIVRTFLIVNIGWYLDRIEDMQECITAYVRTVTAFHAEEFPMAFRNIFLASGTVNGLASLAIAGIGCLVILYVSVLRERTGSADGAVAALDARPFPVRFLVVYGMIMLILFSYMFVESAGGFLYANF